MPDLNQAAGIVEGKWPQKDGVHHAEDGGVGANSEGQYQDGDDGEPRVFPQYSYSIFQVVQHVASKYLLR
jgi:hypothetical protein